MPTKARACCANIGSKPAVILRNHGLLDWAPTLGRAFVILWTLQPRLRSAMRVDGDGPGDCHL